MTEYENAVMKAIDKVLKGNIDEGKRDLKAAYENLIKNNGDTHSDTDDDMNWWDFQR
jgi:hypothetical protein